MSALDSAPRFPKERILDGSLGLVLGLAAAAVASGCAPLSEVVGDALMALECGWRTLHLPGVAEPTQPIYGYGLCLSMAALFPGAESLSELALRRAVVGSTFVPLTYFFVRIVTPQLLRVSTTGARIGGLAAALVLLRHQGIVEALSLGKHGYFAPAAIALALTCWAAGARERRPAVVLLGYAAVPLAVMNHPFALWLLPCALVLTPRLAASSGRLSCGLGLLSWVLLLGPRAVDLMPFLGSSGDLGQLARSEIGLSVSLTEMLQNLRRLDTVPTVLGALGMLAVGLRGPRETARPWALALLASVATVATTALLMKHIRYYHVNFLYPLAGAGLGAWLGVAVDRMRGPEGSRKILGAVGSLGLLAASVGLAGGTNLLAHPLCSDRIGGSTARGSERLQDALLADLGAQGKALVSDLHAGSGRPDRAVGVSFGLLLQGVSPERLGCCAPGEQPRWYFVAGEFPPVLDYAALAQEEGVDLLLSRPEVPEYLLTARSPAALARLRSGVCEQLPAEGTGIWSTSFEGWLHWLQRSTGEDSLLPPDPVQCSAPRPSSPPQELTGFPGGPATVGRLQAVLQEGPFRWARGPEDVPGSLEGAPLVLTVFGCRDDQIVESLLWLNELEGLASRRGFALLDLLLPRRPEERQADGERLCGTPRGEARILGTALDGSLSLRLGISTTPQYFVFDRRGELREHVVGPAVPGAPASQRLEDALDRLWAEESSEVEEASRQSEDARRASPTEPTTSGEGSEQGGATAP